MPRLADQPANAAVIAARGVGLACSPHEATATAVRDGLLRLLDVPDYRRAADEVRAEIASRPSPASLVARLEELVAGR